MYCIAYPNHPLRYSETFIRTHIDAFNWDYHLCCSWYPRYDEKKKKT